MSGEETRERLLHAAITCIEREGLRASTIREIASEAGANVAAVNYHFGSRAKLIKLALQLTIDNGMAEFNAALLDNRQPFRKRLYSFFVQVLAGCERYPNVTRAHLYGTIIDGAPSNPYMQSLTKLVNTALEGLNAEELPLGHQESARRIEIGIRSALMRGMAPRLFELTPAGASSVEDEARRLVAYVLPE